MPSFPLRGWILLGSLVLFAVVVLGVLYWAQFTGRAGSQRGLVIHNELTNSIRVSAAEQEVEIPPGYEWTFVVKREQFPSEVIVFDTQSQPDARRRPVFNQFYEYQDLVDAEFRLSVDEKGLHRTSGYRDTPVPDRTQEVP